MKRFSLKFVVLASVLLCAFSVQADLNDGLVAYYPLNGNANDESGNGNNGIEFGGISYSNGKEGLAANFDGIDDYIKADADNLPTAERTISLWFYANKIEMPRPVPFAYGGVSCGESWFMMLSPEPEPPFYLSGHCHSYDAYGPWFQPPVGAWYHWVITTSSEGTKFFINGIEVAYHNMFINNTFVENKDLAIGVDVSPTGYAPYTDSNVGWFNGLIDEVRVYNRALSTEEILDLTGFKITSSSKLSVQLGVLTSIQFEAKGGIAPFVWSIVDGTLPPGMNFSPDGILSGSPTQSGEFSYDILVSDSDSDPNVAEKHFTLEVVLIQPPPNIRIFKTGSIPVPGRKIDYFILVENIGTVSASEVKVLEVLDPTEDFKFVSTNPQPLFINDFMSRWSVTSLSPGEMQVLSYSVELSPSVQIGTTVYGKAVVLCEECQSSAECLFYSANCESEPPLPYCNEKAATTCRDVCEETCGAGSSSTHAAPAQGALDPNEKLVIAKQYIQPEQLLVYPIHFENIGTIEARDIFITDILDENVDLSTLEILTPDGGSFDPTTRTLNWKLLNRDLLPGETGSVLLSFKALPGLSSGTEIRNKATIQFEVFEPFTTNEVLNIIDAVRPKGIIDSLPEMSSTLEIPISWRGTDEVGEIEYYSILVSVNGGSFSVLLDKTKDKSAIFNGVEGNTYGFICIAIDTAGNIEVQDAIAETSTTIITNINPVARCHDVIVSTDPQTCNVREASVDAGSFDPDGTPITINQNPIGPYNFGDTEVTLTITDDQGLSDQCIATITVQDTAPPIPDLDELPNIIGECSAKIDSAPTAIDNCDSVVTGTTPDPLYYTEQGTHTVTWTYIDNSGNSIIQTQTVIVEGCSALVGDLNGDGCIDRTDYNIIIADIRGPEPHNLLYDLNGDGLVNISDARYLVTKFTNPKGAPCQ